MLVESTIIGCEGIRGTGKTLFATYLCLHAQESLGAKVFHNGCLTFGQYIEVEEIISMKDNLRNAVIFIDEIQTIQDSYRASSTLSFLFTQMLMQLRKRKLVVIWTSQNLRQLNSRLLFQTDFLVKTKFDKKNNVLFWKMTSQGTVAPYGVEKIGRVWRADRFFPYYDTDQLVDPTKAITLTSDMIRQSKSQEQKEQFLAITEEIKKHYDELMFAEIKVVMQNNGLNLTDHMLGKWLVDTYGKPKRTREGRLYTFVGDFD
jgi:hypothetical protein